MNWARQFEQTSGPILQKKLDLTGILTTVTERQVFFIDEIHRLMPDIEEILYSALEDFHVDLVIGQGPGARTSQDAAEALHRGGGNDTAGAACSAASRPIRPDASFEPV